MKHLKALFLAGLLAACSNPDRVVFVTDTGLNVGFDAATRQANIGYTRSEIITGPKYVETGAIPPVYGAVASSGYIYDRTTRQVYATGQAAIKLPNHFAENPIDQSQLDKIAKSGDLSGDRRLMVAGTHTNIGLNFSFLQSSGININLGYKRRELSILPMQKNKNKDGSDQYGSVIASLEQGHDVEADINNGKFEISQFFATGLAAEALADNEEYAKQFMDELNTISGIEKEGKKIAQNIQNNAKTLADQIMGDTTTLTQEDRDKYFATIGEANNIGPSTKDLLDTKIKVGMTKDELEAVLVDVLYTEVPSL